MYDGALGILKATKMFRCVSASFPEILLLK